MTGKDVDSSSSIEKIAEVGQPIALGTDAQGNLLINGSFETDQEIGKRGYELFDSIEGWDVEEGGKIELQVDGRVGAAYHGNTLVELDSKNNSKVYQTLSNLEPGSQLEISFAYSGRPGRDADTNQVEIWWNDQLIDTVTADGKGEKDFVWQKFSYIVTVPESGEAKLAFAAAGRNDSHGGVVDAASVVALGPQILVEEDKTITGTDDRDWLEGGEGAQEFDGLGAADTTVYANSDAGVQVNLAENEASGGEAEGDSFVSIENVHASDHDDTLVGDDGTNRLIGRDGEDNLNGGAGNDILLGGRGADVLDGGEGDRDAAEYDWSTQGVTVNLTTGEGTGGYAEGDVLSNIEYLYGSLYNDFLTGDENVNRLVGDLGDDTLSGMAGNDILIGGQGADVLDGGEGTRDAADYQNATEAVGVDLVEGGFLGEADGDTFTSIEFVYGSDFSDTIIGDDAINRLVGNNGEDVLSGAGGNDYLLGGLGNDTMTGGAGDDVFLFQAAFGEDTITDFEFGAGRTDRIWFKGMGLDDETISIFNTDEGALIQAGEYGTLLLEGVVADSLVGDDFIF
ncbi:MAG: hypothetical protein AAGF28_04215 [Pseudomonadota bacterium]